MVRPTRRGDPGPGPDDERGKVVVSAKYTGPAEAGGGWTQAPPAPGRRRRSTSAEDGTFSTPYELTAGQVGDHRDGVEPGGQDLRADAPCHGRLQGRQPRGLIEGGRAWLKVWVDGKLDPGDRRPARSWQRQDPDVHGQGVDRGADRLVRGHESSPSTARRSARLEERHARDVAVRTAGSAQPDPAAVTLDRADATRLTRSSGPARRRGRCLRSRHPARDGRVVHGRPGRPSDHRDTRLKRLLRSAESSTLHRRDQGGPGRRPGRGPRSARCGVRAGRPSDGGRRPPPSRGRMSRSP